MTDRVTYDMARGAIDSAFVDGVKHLVEILKLAEKTDTNAVNRFTAGLMKLTETCATAHTIVDEKLKTAAI